MLDAANVIFNLNATSQAEVIRRVVEHANALGKISNVEATVQAVQQREEESTTGFGKGVAIPHGKTDGVKEPVLLFAKLAQPIEWKSLDEQPVDMLFMILVPESSAAEHLQILAKLARRLMHDEFVADLRAKTTAESVSEYIQSELA